MITVLLSLVLMVANNCVLATGLDDNSTNLKNSSETTPDSLVLSSQSFPSNQSDSASASASNESINQSENAKFGGPYNVHVYVSNKDDDSLDVSLFIDSELKDTKSISSDAESKFDSYPLPAGSHNFKITWWDEDVKKSCEAEETVDVRGDTSANLYTTANDEPEEFDLSVTLTNENSKDLDAYLYVDDSFEKNKEVSKESTSDFGTISLEEGMHNLSVRWRDADTKIEYEKKKKVTISKDDAVVFYVPAGISFDAQESRSTDDETTSDAATSDSTESSDNTAPSSSYSYTSSSSYEKTTSTKTTDETSSSSDTTIDSTATNSTAGDDSLGSASLVNGNSSASSDAARSDESDESVKSTNSASSISESKSDSSGGGYAYSGSSGSSAQKGSRRISALSSGVMKSSNSLYVYAGIVILAIYLIFRR